MLCVNERRTEGQRQRARTAEKGGRATTASPQRHHHGAGPARHGATSPLRGASQAINELLFTLLMLMLMLILVLGLTSQNAALERSERNKGLKLDRSETRAIVARCAARKRGLLRPFVENDL